MFPSPEKEDKKEEGSGDIDIEKDGISILHSEYCLL